MEKTRGTKKHHENDSGLPDELVKYTKYRWEFLRRNPEYIRDYAKLESELEQLDWSTLDGQPTKEEIVFMRKWRIAILISPGCSYEKMANTFKEAPSFSPSDHDIEFAPSPHALHQLSGKCIDFHRMAHEWLNPEFLPGRPIAVVNVFESDFDGDTYHLSLNDGFAENGTVTVEIDLNYSKTRLAKELKRFLDEWKFLYDDAHKRKAFRDFYEEKNIHAFPVSAEIRAEFERTYKKKRIGIARKYEDRKYHFENFDLYLAVYDLRKEKRSWAEIAQTLELNSVQTARNHYRSACRLVAKGIDAYVK